MRARWNAMKSCQILLHTPQNKSFSYDNLNTLRLSRTKATGINEYTSTNMRARLSLFTAALSFPLLCSGQGWDDSFKLDFSYDPSASNGPSQWGDVRGIGEWSRYQSQLIQQVGNQCRNSRNPSPLDLQETSVCRDLHEPLTRQISDSDCTRRDLTFAITPHSLKAYYPLNDDTCERPTLIISGIPDPYVLLWMEVHARSEHVIEGKRYDAELQMVHMGTQYGDIATVSILIDASATSDDLEFQWLLEQWEEVAGEEMEICNEARKLSEEAPTIKDDESFFDQTLKSTHDPRNLQFSPSPCKTDQFGNGCEPDGPRRRMYPYSLWPTIWYYSYFGSLTAPPCSSIVAWRVLDEPMKISRRQYKQLMGLITLSRNESCQADAALSPTGENFRVLQQRSGSFQTVAHCTPDDFGFFVYPPEEQ